MKLFWPGGLSSSVPDLDLQERFNIRDKAAVIRFLIYIFQGRFIHSILPFHPVYWKFIYSGRWLSNSCCSADFIIFSCLRKQKGTLSEWLDYHYLQENDNRKNNQLKSDDGKQFPVPKSSNQQKSQKIHGDYTHRKIRGRSGKSDRMKKTQNMDQAHGEKQYASLQRHHPHRTDENGIFRQFFHFSDRILFPVNDVKPAHDDNQYSGSQFQKGLLGS